MVTPPLGAAITVGLRAASREAWLLPVSLLVSFLRAVALVPALAVAWALALEGFALGLHERPLSWTAPIEGAAAVLSSGRFLSTVGGLALGGAVLSALLRVAFLSGALPTLAARAAGAPEPRAFATGVAYGFPRQLATSLLAALAELAAGGYLVAASLAALLLAGREGAALRPAALAAAGAAALTTGLAGLVAARLLGDLAAARCAVLGERPAVAFAGAARRLLDRPGGCLLGAAAFSLAGLAAGMLLDPATALLVRAADGAEPELLLGPRLILAFLASLLAAGVELSWLATAITLGCGVDPAGSPPGAAARGRLSA